MSENEQNANKGIEKIRFVVRNSIFILGVIICAGLLLRLVYFPYNVPITLDGLSYFFYANDVSILGHLPTSYNFPNNGWPIFLSFFFSLFHSDNFLDYMMLQRALTIAVSVLSAIPVYMLCRRFVEKQYALVGAALFVFDPRIIQNSVLGETQPLFVFLVAVTLFLFLSKNMKTIYISFATAALLSVIRYEGLLLIIPISAIYLVWFRKEKKIGLKFAICIAIFLIVVAPVSYLRMQTTGENGLTDQIAGGAVATDYLIQNEAGGNAVSFIGNGFINLLKFLGWIMIPTFVFFVPLGFALFLFKRDIKTAFIVFAVLVMLVPSLYAYSRDIQDTRYLYAIFPIFCIFSAYTVKKFSNRFKKESLVLGLMICGIVLSSGMFLEYKKTDYAHELEAYQIAKKIDQIVDVTNNFYPESKYVRVAELSNLTFPTLINGKVFGPTLILTDGYDSLEKFIEDNRYLNLQHLVIDDSSQRPRFLSDVYHNETKYPYLSKEFDSADAGFGYHVKVFRIDYEKFLELKR
jgi:hypothetical protein